MEPWTFRSLPDGSFWKALFRGRD